MKRRQKRRGPEDGFVEGGILLAALSHAFSGTQRLAAAGARIKRVRATMHTQASERSAPQQQHQSVAAAILID